MHARQTTNMKKVASLYLVIIILLSCGLWLFIRHRNTRDNASYIVCTTSILYDTTKQLAGNACSITSLMGPGVDPHLYKPIQSDIFTLAHAELIIYNGLHLEARMAQLLKHLEKPPTLAATKDIPSDKLLSAPDEPTMHDPHVWFDISLWRIVACTISQKLQELFPNKKEYLKQRLNFYCKQLEKLETTSKHYLDQIPEHKRILVTAHDAFAYFAKFYNWRVVSLQGMSTESEAGTKDILDKAAYIAQQEIPAIFVESSISPKSIYAVQEAVQSYGKQVTIGGELLSDAVGTAQENADTYITMIMHNVTTIQKAIIPDEKVFTI